MSDGQGQILTQLGVKHVIYPVHEMGRRVAHLVRGAALDYIEAGDTILIAGPIKKAEAFGQLR